jgi:hypothetical protein
MELTERDHEILRQVDRHRFLRSSHVLSLVPGSSQQILRRLKLLYHHGYLERPRSQLDYYHQGGSREMVYGLGNRATALLGTDGEARWNEKNAAVKQIFLEHSLLVSDFMVTTELACRKANIRFINQLDLAQELRAGRKRELFEWTVKIWNGIKLTAAPDEVFAVEWTGAAGMRQRSYFFLEADRGTMPVIRKSLYQTSFYRKLLAYEATWKQLIHEKRFGFPRFRVLTVTTTPTRVRNITSACTKLKHGHGIFLFTDRGILDEPEQILSAPWSRGKGGTDTLLS